MTHPFEQQLAEQLRGRPLPDEVPELAQRSIAQGRRIRRRRIAGLATALVLVLVVPGLAWTAARRLETDPSPASSTSSPSLVTQPLPVTVILDPAYRPAGPDPYLSTVRSHAIWSPSGDHVDLPDDQVGSVAEFGQGYAWLTGSGADLRLNVSSQRLPVPIASGEVTGVQPGPSGSVMVRTKSGPVLLTTDASLVIPPDPLLRTDQMAATANALWVERDGRVLQVEASNLRGDLTGRVDHPQWREVVFGDPVSDRVVVTDQDGCHVVVDGRLAAPIWTGCDWELSAFSPDGRFAAGTHRYGTRGVVDLTTGRWLLAVDTEANSVHEQVAVDNEGRLSLAMGNRLARFAAATCDLAGNCSMGASAIERLEFVLPNQ